MEKLKVGIIGCGRIFDLNVLGYLDNDDVEITCLCDKKKKSTTQKIEEYELGSTTKAFKDYKEMLDTEELDIVEIFYLIIYIAK